ncbi:MAG: homoserine O-acetyltransferase [bacterium]|nr:homoserine O-acetyltransferase [bacterium]
MKKKLPRVETQFFTFAKTPEDAFHLESGEKFGPITLAYETYGELSEAHDNAILVFHALSGSHHAAGYNPRVPGVEKLWTEEYHYGWWDDFIGPGRALDTRQYFVICANYFGGCYGSIGPSSTDPATGKPYGRRFPNLTISDVVNTPLRLLDHLGIKTLLAVMGGSLGGVMAVDLAMRYPDRVRCVVPIAAGPRATTLHKLANFEQIYAIETDPNFNYGDYYDGQGPTTGLILARMISHKYFVHLHVMEDRARDEIVQDDSDLRGYRLQHQIESYMLHQGKKFIKRFDANTYLRIVNMWQQFNLSAKTDGNLVDALRPCRHQRFLVFSIDSDVCFWPEEQAELCEALKELDINYLYITVHSEKGHDSFLLEPELYTPNIEFLLKETYKAIRLIPT